MYINKLGARKGVALIYAIHVMVSLFIFVFSGENVVFPAIYGILGGIFHLGAVYLNYKFKKVLPKPLKL